MKALEGSSRPTFVVFKIDRVETGRKLLLADFTVVINS